MPWSLSIDKRRRAAGGNHRGPKFSSRTLPPPTFLPTQLAALEAESNEGVWFRLIDKVYDLRNLDTAWAKTMKMAH